MTGFASRRIGGINPTPLLQVPEWMTRADVQEQIDQVVEQLRYKRIVREHVNRSLASLGKAELPVSPDEMRIERKLIALRIAFAQMPQDETEATA